MSIPTSGAIDTTSAGTAGDIHERVSAIIRNIKRFLPAQAPLKDFVHHNTLHAFQHLPFDEARVKASTLFGYRVSMSLKRFRSLYDENKIDDKVVDHVISVEKGEAHLKTWRERLLFKDYREQGAARIGGLRAGWKKYYGIDLDAMVHPTLFRLLCSYLDQGISMWPFPVHDKGFLSSLAALERNGLTSFFRTKIARAWLLAGNHSPEELLRIVVGDDASLYEHYLFDQQFSHQGWSGMVSVIEDDPRLLLDRRKITLRELVIVELLLEVDALHYLFGKEIHPLNKRVREHEDLFRPVEITELQEVLALWQKAFEWTYYGEVIAAIRATKKEDLNIQRKSFQALCCIDDRSSSFRRYLELTDPNCETFGTPGHFNVAFWFKPASGKHYTKLCPAPVNPDVLINEVGVRRQLQKDPNFTRRSHTLVTGWLITQTLGFWSALKLFLNIFRPSDSPATASSLTHTDRVAKLTVLNNHGHTEKHLRVGFTIDEAAERVEGLLRSIALTKDFAPIVYVIGHGASSVNNPHYAAYDCGACSGKPGSVNARVFCQMANNPEVRAKLRQRDIDIPIWTNFIAVLHDTTRDEMVFYDEENVGPANTERHKANKETFHTALTLNAKERSRRFASVDTQKPADEVHRVVKRRSVSLFEPRPEYNHATNAVCVVGRRLLTRDLFLDRRAFLNSYDYRTDPDGRYLVEILRALAPVCGGINLEYFFSRVDNQKLGAGSKLPHNVMGLFGVANGIEGDLRPGLPGQMVEIHDPIRLLTIVEHHPAVVLTAVQRDSETYEWFRNEWINLVALDPATREPFVFRSGGFEPCRVFANVRTTSDVDALVESHSENIPVHLIV